MTIKDKANDVIAFMEEEQTRTNKELVTAAAICTAVGIAIGFLLGKITTSRNTIKKYNKCYSYDFGEEEV